MVVSGETKNVKKQAGALLNLLQRRVMLVTAIVVFAVLAGKVAFVRVFPLPYDEGYHFGLIKVYAHHVSPFLTSQDPSTYSLGAITRDPSYLYHYLLSFPYRLITVFFHSEFSQVFMLRGLNIALGIGSLLLVYRLSRKLGLTSLAAQLVVLALAITPVFFDVAGQINYDNLLLPVFLVAIILTIHLKERLQANRVSLTTFLWWLVILISGSLIKFSFLPVALGAGLFIGAYLGLYVRANGLGPIKQLGQAKDIVMIAVVLLFGLLWGQRYVINTVKYHTPVPQCDAVLSVRDCMAYAPWARNYQLHESRGQRPLAGTQTVAYTRYWVRAMYMQVFSIVSARGAKVVYTPIAIALNVFKFVSFGAIMLGLVIIRRLCLRGLDAKLLIGMIGFSYLMSLWARNFNDFHNLHAIVAVQGRYLLLLVPVFYLLVAESYQTVIQIIVGFQREKLFAQIATLMVVCWLGILAIKRIGQAAVSITARLYEQGLYLERSVFLRNA